MMKQPTQLPQIFNRNMLRLGRQSRGVSLSALAKALGLTSHELQWIEQGKTPFPPELLDTLADALDYPQAFFAQDDVVYGPAYRFAPCEPFDVRVWREVDEREAAVKAERREMNRLRKRVAELEARIRELES